MGVWAWRGRSVWLLGWAGLLGCLLLDNAASIHERGGRWLAGRGGAGAEARLGPLRLIDLGELGVMLLTTLPWAAVVGLGWLRRDGPTVEATPRLLPALAGVAFFGAGVDLIHESTPFGGAGVHAAATVLEDGGELIALSVLLAVVAAGAVRGHAPRG